MSHPYKPAGKIMSLHFIRNQSKVQRAIYIEMLYLFQVSSIHSVCYLNCWRYENQLRII
jgi:hypothetical protein